MVAALIGGHSIFLKGFKGRSHYGARPTHLA
jgi:hypothetical protein